MGDNLIINSPWDWTVFEFTKEASDALFKAIKKKCEAAYGSDADLKAVLKANKLPTTILAAPTTTFEQERLADEIFKKLTS